MYTSSSFISPNFTICIKKSFMYNWFHKQFLYWILSTKNKQADELNWFQEQTPPFKKKKKKAYGFSYYERLFIIALVIPMKSCARQVSNVDVRLPASSRGKKRCFKVVYCCLYPEIIIKIKRIFSQLSWDCWTSGFCNIFRWFPKNHFQGIVY